MTAGRTLTMLYPAFVELGDKNHAYGVVLPDFPGCFSAAAFRFGDSTYAAGICL